MKIMHKFINTYILYYPMEERHRTLLVRQNPWWQGKKVVLPAFKRYLLEKLLRYVKYRQIIALVGLRRVGKTVLMKQIIETLRAPKNNACYISFDDIDFQKYALAEELINYFLEFSEKNETRYLFLDEIQKLPNWADLLKTYYDTEENLKIFVSGSASLEIKNQKETLAGRILTFHLSPLTFGEFAGYFRLEHELSADGLFREYDIKFSGKKARYEKLLESYLVKGAFPELLDVEDEEFIKKYIKESVVEKTIADISKISGEDEKTIYELYRLLVGSNGQLFEILSLSNTLKINRNVVSRCIHLLEKSFMINVIYNFTASVAKQVRTNKKQYSAHSSMVIAMLDYPFGAIGTETVGRFVETAVASHAEVPSFWRTPQKEEVDFVLRKNNELLPVEVKYQPVITGSDVKSVFKFCREFDAGKGIVVTKNMLEKRTIDGVEITFIPAWIFLLVLSASKDA